MWLSIWLVSGIASIVLACLLLQPQSACGAAVPLLEQRLLSCARTHALEDVTCTQACMCRSSTCVLLFEMLEVV